MAQNCRINKMKITRKQLRFIIKEAIKEVEITQAEKEAAEEAGSDAAADAVRKASQETGRPISPNVTDKEISDSLSVADES